MLFLLVSHSIYFFCFKQKTAYEMRISDLSSDVCSSDLLEEYRGPLFNALVTGLPQAGKMQEDVTGIVVGTDETKTFDCVEPLNLTGNFDDFRVAEAPLIHSRNPSYCRTGA